MSDFNTDFNFGQAPQPQAQEVKEQTTVQTRSLTAEEEYATYPLSETERQQVEEFSKKIDLYDSQTVLQYASGTQKQIADFSEQALENVKTKDFGEVGETLARVIGELKNFDAEEEKKGIRGFFKKNMNKLSAMKIRYEKAETNIENICKTLEGHQIQLMKDAAMLDKMYEINEDYFKQLTMYIIAGKRKLEYAKDAELPAMMSRAKATKLSEDLNKANDYASLIARFEKKIYDLELTRTIAMQTAPQIRLIQNNDVLMSEKIQSMLVNTVPLWKNQMVIALGVEHSNKAAQAQRAVTDMTNELLRKNAETLKTATVTTAREMERGIVDVETLEHTNELLLSTIDEVMQIQEEGRQKREAAEGVLLKMENDLKQKLLEINA
ncbi:MAG: toxic anion resistance protein [Firmicutes bacterium]|nr:toxic anion resistance protein [Bacillota bacterium]NBI64812.1 toxic anion resistance protein [Clostridiales bacterium]